MAMCPYSCFVYDGASFLGCLHKPNFMVVRVRVWGSLPRVTGARTGSWRISGDFWTRQAKIHSPLAQGASQRRKLEPGEVKGLVRSLSKEKLQRCG